MNRLERKVEGLERFARMLIGMLENEDRWSAAYELRECLESAKEDEGNEQDQ